jgi:hypothetical protein
MNSFDSIRKAKIVINAQNSILKKLSLKVDKVSDILVEVDQRQNEIKELEKIMDEIEANQEYLDYENIESWNEKELTMLYQHKINEFSETMKHLDYKNWDDLVNESFNYCLENNIDPTLPYDVLLTKEDLKQIKKEEYRNLYKWDKWDYIFVGAAGILASLSDFFLVKLPKNIKYNGYSQKGSPITQFLKEKINSQDNNNWFSEFAKKMEEYAKVPYDTVANGLKGMGGRSHRFQTFGHDPVLGFIFGVLDIMKGTLTGFSYDSLTQNHSFTVKNLSSGDHVNLIEAFLLQIGHLISDVGTKMGIQPPFFTIFQGINIKSPFSPKNRTIGEIARWMYMNGYDLRHFITMSITPAVIEMVLRAYIMIRHYKEKGKKKFILASNVKYRSMLLSAHSIAAAGNVGKIILHSGNPLAINYAEWLAVLRYLIPSVKYWVFDKKKIELAYLEKLNQSKWDELLKNSDEILKIVNVDQLNQINLD